MAASKDGYDDLQEKIKTFLERELVPNYTHLGDTKVAIQFRYTLPETGYLDVDLLLSPHWEDDESYYADLAQIKPPIKRLMYVITTRLITLAVLYTCCPFRFSVSTSRYQKDFIKGHPQRDHVRRHSTLLESLHDTCNTGPSNYETLLESLHDTCNTGPSNYL